MGFQLIQTGNGKGWGVGVYVQRGSGDTVKKGGGMVLGSDRQKCVIGWRVRMM